MSPVWIRSLTDQIKAILLLLQMIRLRFFLSVGLNQNILWQRLFLGQLAEGQDVRPNRQRLKCLLFVWVQANRIGNKLVKKKTNTFVGSRNLPHVLIFFYAYFITSRWVAMRGFCTA